MTDVMILKAWDGRICIPLAETVAQAPRLFEILIHKPSHTV